MAYRTPTLDLSVDPGTGVRSNLDWPHGSFNAEFRVGNVTHSPKRHLDVEMSLGRTAGVTQLLKRDEAVWAVEARCSQTGWAQTYVSNQTLPATMTIEIPHDEAQGLVDLWPGVVSLRATAIEITDDVRRDLFPSLIPTSSPDGRITSIPVEAHRWLVRGRPYSCRAGLVGRSLVEFRSDDNLKKDEMRISADGDGTEHWYTVSLHSKNFDRSNRDTMIGWSAYATALAMLPYNNHFDIDYNDLNTPVVRASSLGQELATALHNSDTPLWDNQSEWDPMRALCNLENMQLPPDQHSAMTYEDDN